MDFFGAGNVMEKIGETEKSVRFFKKALDGNLSDDVTTMAKMKLSYHFKRNEEWDKAVAIWREITSEEDISAGQLFSFRELAMYLEHREKNYEEAQRISEEGYVLSRGISSYYENDFVHRRARLKEKIKKQSAKAEKK
jgi:hypothetical protein